MKIFPSLIAGNILNTAQDIADLEPVCDGFHIDCMDFESVGNVTWGPPTINAIAQKTKKKLWIHLMVKNPRAYIDKMVLRSNDRVSIHSEYVPFNELVAIFAQLKRLELEASLAINPTTPLTNIELFQGQIDHLLLMSVKPGASGQEFLPDTFERIGELNKIIQKWEQPVPLSIDGGITVSVIPPLKKLHIQDIAVGSAIFNNTGDPVNNTRRFHCIKNSH